ncbi:unnamed protein product [Amoebophrya sp. A120]|nr:unnamed protein product [Amoebophrya sp. A120]|eukprot:GSA120T00001824001.1
MPPKAKKKTLTLHEFAGDELAKSALPSASEGLALQKGPKGGGKGDRDGGRKGGDRWGRRNDDDGEQLGRADTGDWFKKESPPGGREDNFGRGGGAGFGRTESWRGGASSGRDEDSSAPKQRPRLNLKPRTVGADSAKDDGDNKSKSNPFGSAKAVDIEKKMSERDANKADEADTWRLGEKPKEGGGGWRDREAARNKDSKGDRRGSEEGWRSRTAGGGKGGKEKSEKKDADFGSLRRSNTNTKPEGGITMVDDIQEEAADDGFTMIKTGKPTKGVEKATDKTEKLPGKTVNRYAAVDSDENSESEQEAAEEDESEEQSEEASEKPDTEGDAKGKESETEELSQKTESKPLSESKPLVKTTSTSQGSKSAGGYMPPAKRAAMEAEEKRKKEQEEKRAAREAELAERAAIRAAEEEMHAKKNAIQAELDAQKQRKMDAGFEESEKMRLAAAEAKRQKQADEKLRKELMKVRKTRFTTNHDAVLMAKFEEQLKSSFPGSLSAEKFDATNFFPEGEVLEKNVYYALLLFCQKILFTAFTEDEMIHYVESSKAALLKLLSTAGDSVNAIELLYASTRVMAEMRNPATKKLPDYNAETAVIESFFWELYSKEIISEEDVLTWFDDVDDDTPGRMDVIFQVTPFVHFLRPPPEAEPGSDEEGDEDDEEDEDDA